MLLPLDGAACDSTEVNNSIFGSSVSKPVSEMQQMYVLGACHAHASGEFFAGY